MGGIIRHGIAFAGNVGGFFVVAVVPLVGTGGSAQVGGGQGSRDSAFVLAGDGWSVIRETSEGELVEVVHVANDPVNMRAASFAMNEDGQPATVTLRQYGDTLVSSSEVPLFYTNPLTGDYRFNLTFRSAG